MDILLSICIPTFNRATLIGETLDSIIPQATEEVEIVIVDGASTDNTEEIIQQYKKKFSRLIYFRGEKNMGVERDTVKSVDLANGKYCWLMTSDDIMKPTAIQQVLVAIKKNPELVLVNAEVRNEDLSKILGIRKLEMESDRIYGPKDQDQLFLDTVDYLSYMGAVVIKKAFWDQRDKTDYLDSDFVHLGVIFQCAVPGITHVLAEPLLSLRYGTATWTPREFEIWGIHWPQVLWSFRDISDDAKRQIYGQEGWRNFKRLLVQRASATYSIKEYLRFILPQKAPKYAKAIAWLIAILPSLLLNLIVVIYFQRKLDQNSQSTLIVLKQSNAYWKRWFSKYLPHF